MGKKKSKSPKRVLPNKSRFKYNARMSAQPPNTITIDPKDPEQALALLTHVSRQINGTADLHDAIRQAIETLKGSLEDQRTWKTISEWGTAPEILSLIRKGTRCSGGHGYPNDAGVAGKSENGPEDRRAEAQQPAKTETDSAPAMETSGDDRSRMRAFAEGIAQSRDYLSPASGSGRNPRPEYFVFNCPTHGESKIPLPPAGETFTPACQKCVEALQGICAEHPDRGLHPRVDSCRNWIPSRSQHPAHF